jgi:hypothetical protein
MSLFFFRDEEVGAEKYFVYVEIPCFTSIVAVVVISNEGSSNPRWPKRIVQECKYLVWFPNFNTVIRSFDHIDSHERCFPFLILIKDWRI